MHSILYKVCMLVNITAWGKKCVNLVSLLSRLFFAADRKLLFTRGHMSSTIFTVEDRKHTHPHKSADNLTPSPSDPCRYWDDKSSADRRVTWPHLCWWGSAADRPSTNTDNTNVISYWPTVHAGIWLSVEMCVWERERKTKRETESGFSDLI